MVVKREYPQLPFRSLPEAFLKRARAKSEKTFEIFKHNGSWFKRTFKESAHKVLSISAALLKLGLKKQDKVAILSQTRSEWALCDLAIQTAGCVTVPIYPNISPETISFILKDSESKVIFVERLKNLKGVELGGVEHVIVFDHDDTEKTESVITLDEFEKSGEPFRHNIDIDILGLDDVATIVYTSGTTGVPKGVMLTYGNILSMVHSVSQVIYPMEDDVIFAWLPFAHIFGRLIIFYSVFNGVQVAYAEGLTKILENIKDIKPTLFPSVPRIYEKAYERIKSMAKGNKAKIFELAESIGEKYVEYTKNNETPPPHILMLYKLFDKLLFSKVREAFGGRIRLCISGGASLDPKIAKFFTACGIKLLEGYGLTETASVVSVNRENKFKFGSIGLPIPFVEIKVAEDGELLIKAPSVMVGYYKRDAETKEVFTEDGWFKTGDIVEIDEEGFIFFKGRKKNIIVTSFGKNIAPEPLEAELQSFPIIESVAIFGDEKPFLVALISLNREEVMKFAKELNIQGSYEEIVRSEKIRNFVKEIIDRFNEKRPSFEKIYRFEIVPDSWTAETGELTPTLKVKKYLIYQKYKDLIESMYHQD